MGRMGATLLDGDVRDATGALAEVLGGVNPVVSGNGYADTLTLPGRFKEVLSVDRAADPSFDNRLSDGLQTLPVIFGGNVIHIVNRFIVTGLVDIFGTHVDLGAGSDLAYIPVLRKAVGEIMPFRAIMGK